MRKMKKMLSLLLAVCMMLSVALPLAVSAATVSFSDVSATHTYHQAITNLAADGILNGFEDGTFKPEEPVTRAQFTKILCYALGVGDLTYSGAKLASFPDVVSDHWAIHNITTAYNSKIINGYDDGTFKPENSVLYEQAVKMAVCALGYPEDRAVRLGGYPNGYIRIAADIKMLKELVDVKTGQPLTRGAVAQLIDNMMDAKIYSDDNASYGDEDAGSLRDQVVSTKKQALGRVVAVYGTALYANETSTCNRKQIELELDNGTREFYGIEDIEMNDSFDFLGRSVIVYYDEDRSADYNEATNIVFQSKKNHTVTIDLDNIDVLRGSTLEYYENMEDDPVDISIASDIDIILNGMAVSDTFADVLTAASGMSGYVTLVCSLDNVTADVAFVKTYDTMVVGSKDNKNYKIYAHNDSSRSYTLDETDRSKTIKFTKDGKAATFSSIATGNVVSVSRSGDGKLIDVQISSVTKKGTVSEIDSFGQIRLGSDTAVYKQAIGCVGTGTITAGSYATFYLDAFGKIARYQITAAKSYKFGYLAAAEEGSFSNPGVDLMIFSMSALNATASPSYYSLASTVRIDGQAYTVSKDSNRIMSLLAERASRANVNAAIDGTSAQNATYAQPIRFTTSGTNEIDSLLTVASTGELSTSLQVAYDYMTTPILCRADKTTLGKYSISSSVPILVVPTDRTGGTYMTKSNAFFKKDESYYVQLANINSQTNQPQAIYVYGTATGGADVTTPVIDEHSIPMIVTEVIPRANYEGVVRISLKLQGVDGTTLQVYDDSRTGTSLISSIEAGDIIRVAADSLGMVEAIERIVSANNVAAGTASGDILVNGTNAGTSDLNAPFRAIWGKVYSASANTVVIVPSFSSYAESTQETYSYTDSVKLYIIDTAANTANNRVQEGTFADIIGYRQQADNASNMLLYTEKGNVVAMIVIK